MCSFSFIYKYLGLNTVSKQPLTVYAFQRHSIVENATSTECCVIHPLQKSYTKDEILHDRCASPIELDEC